jgi:serine kinase of HPr protein (carbohydrate metabolism regulator)
LTNSPTIHASAVLTGAKAVLIRGESGSGKSRLVLRLIQCGALPFARLVGDDRVHVEAVAGRLIVRPAKELAGMIEVCGVGIERLPYEPVAVVGLVVDFAADVDRLPEPAALETSISGITLPRLAVPSGTDPLPAVLDRLRRGN